MDTEKITIGILNHDNNIYAKYVSKSLDKLQGYFDLIIEKNKKPAQAYNDIIDKSNNRYIVFLHADITFSSDFINNINLSIKANPNFGAMSCSGVIRTLFGKIKLITSEFKEQKEILTTDSCCLVINKEHNLFFDSERFDEYHMYVEDYCMQARKNLGLNIYTILTDWIWVENYYEYFEKYPNSKNWFIHHSHTFTKKGSRWGNWEFYKNLIDKKWGIKVRTP